MVEGIQNHSVILLDALLKRTFYELFHAAGECRRQVKDLTNFVKKCQHFGIL